VTPLTLAQLLEIEFSGKLNGATRLRIAAGIDRLIDGVDPSEDGRTGAEVTIRTCKIRVIEGVVRLWIYRGLSALPTGRFL
jgi:hypothetical protein